MVAGKKGDAGGSLRRYQEKRDFAITPEPRGLEGRARRDGLSYVIQKHAARALHYDFRLELDGVLKSWAVPKGPSLDPADKRLAMQTEDHPLEYGDFEGIIPEGQYGGGTVMLWDRGIWVPVGDPQKAYLSGAMKFQLHGEKLRGGWALVRIRGRERRANDRTWLLIKEQDAAARRSPSSSIVEERPESVATGRSLPQIAADGGSVWNSDRPGREEPRARDGPEGKDRSPNTRGRRLAGPRRPADPGALEASKDRILRRSARSRLPDTRPARAAASKASRAAASKASRAAASKASRAAASKASRAAAARPSRAVSRASHAADSRPSRADSRPSRADVRPPLDVDSRPARAASRPSRPDSRAARAASRPAVAPKPADLSGARKRAFPAFQAPQHPTLVNTPPAGEEWLHEMKYDGYRIICRIARGKASLLTRNGSDWTRNFPLVALAAEALAADAILDGEVAVLEPDGTTSFQALQNVMGGGPGQTVLFLFDIPYLDGYDLQEVPLERRKELLRALIERGAGSRSVGSHGAGGRGVGSHGPSSHAAGGRGAGGHGAGSHGAGGRSVGSHGAGGRGAGGGGSGSHGAGGRAGGLEGVLRYTDHVLGQGEEVFRRACAMGLEGIVSKRRDAHYQSGRSRAWLKVKCTREQEVVIGGFTEPAGSRVGIGALLVGVYEGKRLRYVGKVGTGYSQKILHDLRSRLEGLEQKASPFVDRVPGAGKAHWAAPRLVAQVRFAEWTREGRLRHPSFEGLRLDKPAREVIREEPRPISTVVEPSVTSGRRSDGKRARRSAGHEGGATRPARSAPGSVGRAAGSARDASGSMHGVASDARAQAGAAQGAKRSARADTQESVRRTGAEETAEHGGKRGKKRVSKTVRSSVAQAASPGSSAAAEARVAGVRLTHPDRVLYEAPRITKQDLALFYESIATFILPHLRGRPLSLVRCPEGASKGCFYMKHASTFAVHEAIRRVSIEERKKTAEYLVVDSLPALIGLVQMSILEIHTWNSVYDTLERPDRVVFDLDPGPGVSWARVIEAAQTLRKGLSVLDLGSFVKTTGGKGLHVVVPLTPAAGWDECFEFSRLFSEAIAGAEPRAYTTVMSKARRKDRIFIDYHRNRRGSTSVAAYSTRIHAGAPVSTPLTWDELRASVRPDQYNVRNLPERLAALRKDPWASYWKTRQRLPSSS